MQTTDKAKYISQQHKHNTPEVQKNVSERTVTEFGQFAHV